MKNIIKVLVDSPSSGFYDYQCETLPAIGCRVIVPFGEKNALHLAVVYEHPLYPDTSMHLKDIAEVIDQEPVITTQALEVAKKAAAYHHCSVAKSLFALTMPALKSRNAKALQAPTPRHHVYQEIALNSEQLSVYSQLVSHDKAYNKHLLAGVPGSGKTRTFLALALDHIKAGRQVLLLAPEILLAKNIAQECKKVTSVMPHLYHSKVSASLKLKLAGRLLSGETLMVVGARSALHLPFTNLGLIVMDEEHDESYKEEVGISYHASKIAEFIAQTFKIPLLTVSATPSIQSYYQCLQGNTTLHQIERAYRNVSFPLFKPIKIDETSLRRLRPEMIEELSRQVKAGHQCLIYINRRGYAPRLQCLNCHQPLGCPNCSHALVMHRASSSMNCHLCGYRQEIVTACPHCSSPDMVAVGSGTERIALQLQQELPHIKIARIDGDNSGRNNQWEELQEKIVAGEVDIVIGTRLIGKGHNFPKVSYCLFLGADFAFHSHDWNAQERLAQEVIQLAGRTMRYHDEKKSCIVSIPTSQPSSSLWKLLLGGKYLEFLKQELKIRKKWDLPPYSKIALWKISATSDQALTKYTTQLQHWVESINTPCVRGPLPAPTVMIKGRYRWNIMICGKNQQELGYWIDEVRQYFQKSSTGKVHCRLDIDPVSFD